MAKLNIDCKDVTKAKIKADAIKAGKKTVKEYVFWRLGVIDVEKKKIARQGAK